MPRLPPVTIATRSLRPRSMCCSLTRQLARSSSPGPTRRSIILEEVDHRVTRLWRGPVMTAGCPALTRVLQNMHSRAGAVDQIEPAVLVGAYVIRLHRRPVAFQRRHVAADLLRM